MLYAFIVNFVFSRHYGYERLWHKQIDFLAYLQFPRRYVGVGCLEIRNVYSVQLGNLTVIISFFNHMNLFLLGSPSYVFKNFFAFSNKVLRDRLLGNFNFFLEIYLEDFHAVFPVKVGIPYGFEYFFSLKPRPKAGYDFSIDFYGKRVDSHFQQFFYVALYFLRVNVFHLLGFLLLFRRKQPKNSFVGI